ncbi:contractile injection system protein, VgrG/Pvc8 family [Streptomyces sp. NPDC093970]|uniref:phage late control D family protein n=1 Tax=Streptomyces sp. NPDC093970 TaxID=3155076 RepID=UPI003440177C
MQNDHLLIEIDGAEASDLKCDLIGLDIELDDELAGLFRMTVALRPNADGSWTHLDDGRFALWHEVAVTAGLEDDSRKLLTGRITHIRPEFGPGMEQCRLEVWGMDASVLMDRTDVLKAWPNMKDSDIATLVFQQARLIPQVADTSVVHHEETSTIVQRETDIRFLRRLALRNGYECFVDGDTGYFRPPELGEPVQDPLNVHAGPRTNVDRFSLEVEALTPADVNMSQLDHTTGELLQARSTPGRERALGVRRPADLLPPGLTPGQVTVARAVATGAPEMEAICQSLHDRGEWFVTGEGEVAANRYGSVLLPRRTVVVNGVGRTHSGTYFVTHVTHRFREDSYTQHFRVGRNALGGPAGVS